MEKKNINKLANKLAGTDEGWKLIDAWLDKRIKDANAKTKEDRKKVAQQITKEIIEEGI